MIKKVILIFKTHLDVGFTDYSANIVSKYFNQYIPKAIKIAYELKDTDTKFIWTVGSWMINEGLKAGVQGLEEAIKDGLITWHGLPFTTHCELMSEKLFEYGIDISKRLDKKFGKNTVSAKMTDVPGHTIGIVPIMARNNIKFLHIGVNPAFPKPEVPDVFRWKCGKAEVIVMYNSDYGDCFEIGDTAFVFKCTGDNLGPQSVEEIQKIYKECRERYPDAEVTAGTLDDIYESIKNMDFEVVEKEIGDTWIHGGGTDPKKVSGFRALLRKLDEGIKNEWDLIDSLLLVPEHTWGMDLKSHYKDTEHFFDFEQPEESEIIVKSWEEQREYVNNASIVMNYDLETETKVIYPDIDEFSRVENNDDSGIEIYWQLLDNSFYDEIKKKVLTIDFEWAIWDMTKVGLSDYEGGVFKAEIVSKYKKEDKSTYFFEFNKNVADKYGLPKFILEKENGNFEVKWFDKKASRLPQAFWVKFTGLDENWQMEKMGQWIKPENVLGNPYLSAVGKYVKNKDVMIETLDAPLVAPFGMQILKKYSIPDKQNLLFNLYNNVWNTNFPMWYSDDAKFRFKILKHETI